MVGVNNINVSILFIALDISFKSVLYLESHVGVAALLWCTPDELWWLWQKAQQPVSST